MIAARGTGRIDKVFVWTVDEGDRLRYLVDLGVDGILTDDLALLRRIVGGK